MKNRRSIGRAAAACIALLLCGLLWSEPALAAPATTSNRQPNATQPKDDFVFYGKVYKPKVFLFFGKPKLNLDWRLDDPRFKRSFLERTVDSVWTRPF